MIEIVVKIMEELISTLALVTKKLKERKRGEFVLSGMLPYSYLTQRDADKLKSLLRGKAADEDIKEALYRLDRLTQDELRNVAAQTLGVVSGEQTRSNCNPTSTESLPRRPSIRWKRPGRHQYVCRRQRGDSLSD